VCYISDLTKIRADFPHWRLEYGLSRIIGEIVERHASREAVSTR
jgi:hypothetical protein